MQTGQIAYLHLYLITMTQLTRSIILLGALMISQIVSGQRPTAIDSIDNIIPTVTDDSLRAELYNLRGQKWSEVNLDSCYESYKKSLSISEPKFLAGDMVHVYNVAGSYTSFAAIYNKKGNNLTAIKWANKTIDVLRKAQKSELKLRKLITSYNSLGTLYGFVSKLDSSIWAHSKAVKLSNKLDDKKEYASSINNLALALYYVGEVDSAQTLFLEALSIREEFAPKKDLAQSYNNVAILYMRSGDSETCLEYLQKALEMREEIGDSNGIANSLGNMAYVLNNQGNFEKAVEYYQKSLALNRKMNQWSSVCGNLNNIGILYNESGQHELALETFKELMAISKKTNSISDEIAALEGMASVEGKQNKLVEAKKHLLAAFELSKTIENRTRHSNILRNLGSLYYKLDEPDKAIEFLKQALEISLKNNITSDLCDTHNSLGEFYKSTGKLKEAEYHLNKALELSKKLGYPRDIIRSSKLLSEIYVDWGQYKNAYEMKVLQFDMHDSITRTDNMEAINDLNVKYQTDKKEKELALKEAELREKDLRDKKRLAEIERAEIENEKRNSQLMLSLIGLGILLIMSGFVYRGYIQKRKANTLISKQKAEVDHAYAELGEKNKEILDSINYAKRIQNAILPPPETVKEHLRDAFIVYEPKDIVAGDFYWMEPFQGEKQNESGVLFAAADCTGHGVPGAMVSVVCHNGLNRSVREHGLTDPGRILDKTRDIIIEEFVKSADEVKDGMDIALCSLTFTQNVKKSESGSVKSTESDAKDRTVSDYSALLKYAGAHNPLWVVRKTPENGSNDGIYSSEVQIEELEGYTLIEIKADKQPIGQYPDPQPYKTNEIELEPKDAIYVFSDGFIDQFGGEKGKKFKAKNFKTLLLSIQNLSMEEQGKELMKVFEKWKGDFEQLDDVCVIGVRV